MIDLNDYLAFYPEVKVGDFFGETELNEILLKSMNNSRRRQNYVHSFDCESITKNKYVKMFERTEIAESIYEGVV